MKRIIHGERKNSGNIIVIKKLPPYNPDNEKTFDKYTKVKFSKLNKPKVDYEMKILNRIEPDFPTSRNLHTPIEENEIGKVWRF